MMPPKSVVRTAYQCPGHAWRVLCLWESCAVLFFGDQSSGAMPASLATRVHSSTSLLSNAPTRSGASGLLS
jgi:hypothetical protein